MVDADKTGLTFDMSELDAFADKFPIAVVDTALEYMTEALGGETKKEMPKDHGNMLNSTTVVKIGNLQYAVNIGAGYWRPVQFGRKEVLPVNAKVLRFEIKGQVIFAMRSKAVAANPFLDRAMDNVTPRIPQFVALAIKRATT